MVVPRVAACLSLCSSVSFGARCLLYIASISAGLWHLQEDPGTLLSIMIVEEGSMEPQLWAFKNHSPLEAPADRANQALPLKSRHFCAWF